MKIFILEDSSERNEFFKKKLKEYDVTICDKAEVAIEMVKNQKFDVYFLDHDLDESETTIATRYKTGYDFATYMEKELIPYKFVFIHTMNPVGATKMADCFYADKVKISPYPILANNFDYHKKLLKKIELEGKFLEEERG